jgi:hypothetical protein
MTYSIETHRRVYDDDNGNFLTIRPSPDFPDGNVCLMTEGEEKEYFGEIRLDLPVEMMRKIAEALIAACDEAEAA